MGNQVNFFHLEYGLFTDFEINVIANLTQAERLSISSTHQNYLGRYFCLSKMTPFKFPMNVEHSELSKEG